MSYLDSQGILHSDTGELIAAPSGAQKSAGGFWVSGENRYGVAPKDETISALGDLSGLSLSKEGTDLASLISTSLPAINKADIEAQTKEQLTPQRESLLGKYSAAIAQQ